MSYVVTVKSRIKILQNFVASSEYMNFMNNWNDPNNKANPRNEEAARQEVGNLNNKANLTSKTFVKGGLLPTLAKLMIVMWRLIEGQMEWVSIIIRIRVLDDSRYKLQ